MKKNSLFSFVLLIFFTLALISVSTVSVFSIKTLSGFIYKEVENSLIQQGHIIRNQISYIEPGSPDVYLKLINGISEKVDARISLIDLNGKVLSDSHKNYREMENHSDRPEILDALDGKTGISRRRSSTLSENMLYTSIPPGKEGIIVRVALPVDFIGEKISEIYRKIIIFSLIILLLAVLISIFSARSFTNIIDAIKNISIHYSRGDFSKKLKENGPAEVLELKRSINSMGEQLQYIINKTTFQKNELQAMVNSMVESVILLDKDLNIKKMNSAAEKLSGYKFNESKNKKISDILNSDTINTMVNTSFSMSEILENTLCLNNDLEQYVQAHSSPIMDSNGSRQGILLVINDITRTKRLENMRKEFVSNVSHELKTPVTLINGYVETLLDGALENKEKLQEFLSVINKHSRRINAIIDDLLILSNIEDRGIDIQTENILLYDLLFSAYTSALDIARKEDIEIKIVCYEKLHLSANPILLEQAIFNLICNAVKYAGRGSTIIISGKLTHSDNKKKVEITVEDNGIGIEKDQLDRIFERFYRIDKKQSRKVGGTGLGLSIVRHIALAHKGEITVKSEKNRGCRFSIILPVNLTES